MKRSTMSEQTVANEENFDHDICVPVDLETPVFSMIFKDWSMPLAMTSVQGQTERTQTTPAPT